jgi:hypothetical protein
VKYYSISNAGENYAFGRDGVVAKFAKSDRPTMTVSTLGYIGMRPDKYQEFCELVDVDAIGFTTFPIQVDVAGDIQDWVGIERIDDLPEDVTFIHREALPAFDVDWDVVGDRQVFAQTYIFSEPIVKALLSLDLEDLPPFKRRMRMVIDEQVVRRTIEIRRDAGMNLGLTFRLCADTDRAPFVSHHEPNYLLPGQKDPAGAAENLVDLPE